LLVLTFGSLALCLLIGYRHVTSMAAEGAASADQSAPPEIKKGMAVSYRQPLYPVDWSGYDTPTVEEVRGKWVRLKWEPNELGKKQEGYQVVDHWVNFDTVTSFRVVAAAAPKKAEEKQPTKM
jgi:hypothetical protein